MKASDHPAPVRLFCALPLPEEASAAVSRWTGELKRDMSFRKWVHHQDYHITVQFLGDTDISVIPAIHAALREAVLDQPPFQLKLNGAGVFGQPASPRVLWAGIEGEIGKLNMLHKRITEAMAPLGFIPEERPYKPHITAARKYTGGILPAGLLDQGPEPVGWKADSIVLYRTRMHEIPMYEIQEQFMFGV